MTGILSNKADTKLIAPSNLHELVRGKEQDFVNRMTPIVRKQSVTLDLARVERIDAAGISALISLYGSAHSAGNEFNVVCASPHVAEILTLVGLDRILVSHNAVPRPQSEPCCAQSAA